MVNIVLHALNGVLVFFTLRRLRVPAPWWGAMLWVLHPVQIESVAWITELKNTQSGFFFFSALLCFLRFEASQKRSWYVAALACGAAAYLSKPSTVVLPLILLLCAWWERRRWQWTDVVRVAPFFALALAMGVITVIEQNRIVARTASTEWNLGLAERLVIAGRAVWFYAAKLIWPARLTFVYPHWDVNPRSWWSWMPLTGLVAVGAFLWVRRGESLARAALFGLACFVAALLPVAGFIDVYYFRFSFVADHFQYLASVGLIALGAAAVKEICERTGRLGQQTGSIVGAVLLLVFGILTWKQGRAYQDVETLWKDTLAKNPACWLAHNNLALLLTARGQLQEAIWHCEQGLRIKPDYLELHNNLGLALLKADRIQDAISRFQRALQIQPGSVVAHNNLGLALSAAGKTPEAIAQYEEALRVQPGSAATHHNLGRALLDLGRVPEAVIHFEEALRIKPDYAEAHNNLGNALLRLGRVPEATAHFEEALRIQPDSAAAHYNLGFVLSQVGRIRDAIHHFDQALLLQPGSAQDEMNLAWMLATVAPADGGDPARAVSLALRACEQLVNRTAACLDTLAAAYAAAGRFDEAAVTAQNAIALAREAGQTEQVGQIQTRLQLYRSGRAYRQFPDAASAPSP